jgi:hypothetical protein
VPRKSTTPRPQTRAAPGRPAVRRTAPAGKRAFDIDEVMSRVRDAVGDRPKAVLFELAERGYGSPFEILVACLITIRTLEEVSLPTCSTCPVLAYGRQVGVTSHR